MRKLGRTGNKHGGTLLICARLDLLFRRQDRPEFYGV